MDEPDPSVEVTVTQHDAESAEIRLVGELTEGARRPLLRAMTDLLLNAPGLRRVQIDTRGVTFMDSAGMATLVQVQKLCQPRGIDVALVVQGTAVVRPLTLSGLWHRFTIIERHGAAPDVVHGATHRATEDS
jgi:stage II sporulation protein AA (anti-sigma F factor antagonist)